MKALPESHKLQVADAFCKTLVRILMKNEKGEEQLADEEKNKIFQDIEELKIFTNGQKWQELVTYLKSVEHLPKDKKRVSDGIKAIIEKSLRSELVKEWVILHLEEDFLNVLDVSLRRFNNYVLPITVEFPDYIKIDDPCEHIRYQGTRRNAMISGINELKRDYFLSQSNKVVIIKFDCIKYPDNFPQKIINKDIKRFEGLVLTGDEVHN